MAQVIFVRPTIAHDDIEVSLATIGTAALAIVRDCVEGGGQGGLVEIAQNRLSVSVFGRMITAMQLPSAVNWCPNGL